MKKLFVLLLAVILASGCFAPIISIMAEDDAAADTEEDTFYVSEESSQETETVSDEEEEITFEAEKDPITETEEVNDLNETEPSDEKSIPADLNIYLDDQTGDLYIETSDDQFLYNLTSVLHGGYVNILNCDNSGDILQFCHNSWHEYEDGRIEYIFDEIFLQDGKAVIPIDVQNNQFRRIVNGERTVEVYVDGYFDCGTTILNFTHNYSIVPEDAYIECRNGIVYVYSEDKDWLETIDHIEILAEDFAASINNPVFLGNCVGFGLLDFPEQYFNTDIELIAVPEISGANILYSNRDHFYSNDRLRDWALGITTVIDELPVVQTNESGAYLINDGADILICSDNMDWINHLLDCDPDQNVSSHLFIEKAEYPSKMEYSQEQQECNLYENNRFLDFGCVKLVDKDGNLHYIRNTLNDKPLVKDGNSIRISGDYLKQIGISRDAYRVEVFSNSYYGMTCQEFSYTGLLIELPDDVSFVEDTNGDLLVSSIKDPNLAENIHTLDLNGTHFNINDECIAENGTLRIPASVHALDNGNYFNCSIMAYGYIYKNRDEDGSYIWEGYNEYEFSIKNTQLKTAPSYSIRVNNAGDLIISCSDLDYLSALTAVDESYRTYMEGRLSNGVVFVRNHGYSDFQFKVSNEEWYEHEILVLSGNSVILKSEAQISRSGIINDTYRIKLNVRGYYPSEEKTVTFTNANKLVPDNLRASLSGNNLYIYATSNSSYIDAINYINISCYDDDYTYDLYVSQEEISKNGTTAVIDVSDAGLSDYRVYDIHINAGGYISGQIPLNETRYYINYKNLCDAWVPSTTYYVYNNSGYLTLEEPYRENYVFKGWYLDQNYNTKIERIYLNSAKDYTLYAKWESLGMTFKFNANGGTGKMNPVYLWSENSKLPYNTFTRKGYQFDGWELKKNEYLIWWIDDGEVLDLSYFSNYFSNEETLELKARWSLAEYDIMLDPQGGVLSNKQSYDSRLSLNSNGTYSGTYTIASAAFKLPTLTKEGYKFGGWYLLDEEGNFTKTKLSSLAKGSEGNKKIRAKFSPVAYAIKYNLNSGKITSAKNTYSVSYDVENNPLVLPEAYRKGYLFDGWYLNYNSKTKEFTNRISDIYSLVGLNGYKKVSLYAKWIPITYTVIFTGEGLSDVSMDCSYDVSYKLNNDIFEVPGKIVSKWNYSYIDAKGKTVSKTIAGNASIKNLLSENGESIELSVATSYDKKTGVTSELWKTVNYTIKYSLPKGVTNGSKNPTKYLYTEEESVYRLNNPIKLGYDFLYWEYTDRQNNIQTIYPVNNGTKDGYAYLPAKLHQNIVLTPVFEDVPAVYSINYSGNLGSFAGYNPNPVSYSYSKTNSISLLNPIREGYTFAGWYLNNKKVTSIVKGTHGNLVLEARWK